MALDRAPAVPRPSRDAAPSLPLRLGAPERRALLAAHDALAIALPLALLLHVAGAPLAPLVAAWLASALPALLATEQYALARRRDRALTFSTASGFAAATLTALFCGAPSAVHLALLAALGATGLALPAGRRALESRLLAARFRRRLLVVGTPQDALAVHDALSRHPLAGDRPIGLVLTEGALPRPFPLLVLGAAPQSGAVARRWACHEAVAGHTALTGPMPALRLTDAISYCAELTGRIPVRLADVRWLTEHTGRRPQGLAAAAARIADLTVGALLLAPALPVMGAIALSLRLTQPGPWLTTEPCLGRDGAVIRLAAFRTTTAHGRVPPWGALLHATGLDRLPHLLAVLRGDMSLVGPAPHPVAMASELATYVPHYAHRLAVKPGLTGWAQIHAPFESPMRAPEALLGYDLYYLQHRGPLLSALILARTPWVVLARLFAPRLP